MIVMSLRTIFKIAFAQIQARIVLIQHHLTLPVFLFIIVKVTHWNCCKLMIFTNYFLGDPRMNKRIRTLRNELHLTQQEFADRLKISRNNIAGYESGTRAPSDAVISLICSAFHVNEDWLLHGKGEMFVPQTRHEILERLAEDMDEAPNSFKSRFIEAMSKLDEKDWKQIERIAQKLVNSPLSYEGGFPYLNVAEHPQGKK